MANDTELALITEIKASYLTRIKTLEVVAEGLQEVRTRLSANLTERENLTNKINADQSSVRRMRSAIVESKRKRSGKDGYFEFLDHCATLADSISAEREEVFPHLPKIYGMVLPKLRKAVAYKTIQYYNNYLKLDETAPSSYAFLGALHRAIWDCGDAVNLQSLAEKFGSPNYDICEQRAQMIRTHSNCIDTFNCASAIAGFAEHEPEKIIAVAYRVMGSRRKSNDVKNWVKLATEFYNFVYRKNPEPVEKEPENIFLGALHRVGIMENSPVWPHVDSAELERRTGVERNKFYKHSLMVRDFCVKG